MEYERKERARKCIERESVCVCVMCASLGW